jgi:hypothetical protein
VWQDRGEFFSRTPARPGGPVDLGLWPTRLGADVPRLLAKLTLPG